MGTNGVELNGLFYACLKIIRSKLKIKASKSCQFIRVYFHAYKFSCTSSEQFYFRTPSKNVENSLLFFAQIRANCTAFKGSAPKCVKIYPRENYD